MKALPLLSLDEILALPNTPLNLTFKLDWLKTHHSDPSLTTHQQDRLIRHILEQVSQNPLTQGLTNRYTFTDLHHPAFVEALSADLASRFSFQTQADATTSQTPTLPFHSTETPSLQFSSPSTSQVKPYLQQQRETIAHLQQLHQAATLAGARCYLQLSSELQAKGFDPAYIKSNLNQEALTDLAFRALLTLPSQNPDHLHSWLTALARSQTSQNPALLAAQTAFHQPASEFYQPLVDALSPNIDAKPSSSPPPSQPAAALSNFQLVLSQLAPTASPQTRQKTVDLTIFQSLFSPPNPTQVSDQLNLTLTQAGFPQDLATSLSQTPAVQDAFLSLSATTYLDPLNSPLSPKPSPQITPQNHQTLTSLLEAHGLNPNLPHPLKTALRLITASQSPPESIKLFTQLTNYYQPPQTLISDLLLHLPQLSEQETRQQKQYPTKIESYYQLAHLINRLSGNKLPLPNNFQVFVKDFLSRSLPSQASSALELLQSPSQILKKSLSSGAKNLLSQAGQAIKSLGQQLGPLLKQAGTALANTIRPALAAIGQFITTTVIPAIGSALSAGAAALASVTVGGVPVLVVAAGVSFQLIIFLVPVVIAVIIFIQLFHFQPLQTANLYTTGPISGDSYNGPGLLSCINPIPPTDFTPNPTIADKANNIANNLLPGYWNYYNHSPDYPELYNDNKKTEAEKDPNICYTEGCNIFWCTYLVIKSYFSNGWAPTNLRSDLMMQEFCDQGKFVAANEATPDTVVVGSVVFFFVSGGPSRVNHVGIVTSVSPAGIVFRQSNAVTTKGSLSFSGNGGVSSPESWTVTGFGLP